MGERIEGAFVYVVRGDHNLVKVGVTTNPRARLAELRTGSGFPIDFAFIGVTPGTGYDIEKDAHAMLAPHRVNGEWFDVSPEIATSAVIGAAGRLGQKMSPIPLEMCDRVLQIAAGNPPPKPFSYLRLFFGSLAMMLALSFLWLAVSVRFSPPGFEYAAATIPFLAVALAYWAQRRFG